MTVPMTADARPGSTSGAMGPAGIVHTAFATLAILFGVVVLLLRKGGSRHRVLGWAYVISMAVMLSTAFMIYRLTGAFGPFHAAAVLALVPLVAGVLAARQRPRGRWLRRHYFAMTYSYVGLLAAAAAESTTRLRLLSFWWAVLLASLAVFALGALLITRNARGTLRKVESRK
jgi:uncharacterized membrane protein